MDAHAGSIPGWGDEGSARGDAAAWSRRAGASLFDGLVQIVPAMLAFAVVLPSGAVRAAIVSGGVYLTVIMLYGPFLMAREGRYNGQTLGKQLAGTRVVHENGQPLDLAQAAIREVAVKHFLFGLGYFLALLPNLLDALWPLWDKEGQALHDKVVSTRVVRT